MKYIKPYQIFEASASAPAALTQEQIDWLDECADWSWKLNPSTGLIDVDGDFDCREQGLTDLKGVKFGKVGERFDCEDNHLTSLVGAPQSVGGGFYCDRNRLTTLVGAPQKVGGDFWGHRNQLTSMVGAPQTVKGSFYCADNSVSESTLKAIFALMKSGMAYQQALEKRWPKMKDVDRVLMYKQMTNLPPEDIRKYKALEIGRAHV